MNQDEARLLYAHDQSEMITHMPYLEDVASRCAVIIEIGSGHGNGSTRAFSRGLIKTGGWLLTVDEDPEKPSLWPECEWMPFHGDSRSLTISDEVKQLLTDWQEDAPDLIYIDTDHTKPQLAAELQNWFPLATPKTLWLFHDTWMSGMYSPMVEAIEEFCAEHIEWEYVELTKESHGLGMMRWRQQ